MIGFTQFGLLFAFMAGTKVEEVLKLHYQGERGRRSPRFCPIFQSKFCATDFILVTLSSYESISFESANL